MRQLRWPDGVRCPNCGARDITKRGFHTQQSHRQRSQGGACECQFDDLTDTIFEGHHQALRTWVLCLSFMGLNLSNQQIAAELDLPPDDAPDMTTRLREGVGVKKASVPERRCGTR